MKVNIQYCFDLDRNNSLLQYSKPFFKICKFFKIKSEANGTKCDLAMTSGVFNKAFDYQESSFNNTGKDTEYDR